MGKEGERLARGARHLFSSAPSHPAELFLHADHAQDSHDAGEQSSPLQTIELRSADNTTPRWRSILSARDPNQSVRPKSCQRVLETVEGSNPDARVNGASPMEGPVKKPKGRGFLAALRRVSL